MIKSFLQLYRNKWHILAIYITTILMLGFAIITYPGALMDRPDVLEIRLGQYENPVVFYRIEGNASDPSLMEDVAFQYKLAAEHGNSRTQFVVINSNSTVNDDVLTVERPQLPPDRERIIAGATFMEDQIIAWLNNRLIHVAPLTMNLVHNALLRYTI